jgi:hypothetical protein
MASPIRLAASEKQFKREPRLAAVWLVRTKLRDLFVAPCGVA